MCEQTAWCGQTACMRKFITVMIADGIDKIVEAAFPDGNIAVDIVDSAMVSVMSTYSTNFTHSQRMLMLNEHVEAMIANFRQYPDGDLQH